MLNEINNLVQNTLWFTIFKITYTVNGSTLLPKVLKDVPKDVLKDVYYTVILCLPCED